MEQDEAVKPAAESFGGKSKHPTATQAVQQVGPASAYCPKDQSQDMKSLASPIDPGRGSKVV